MYNRLYHIKINYITWPNGICQSFFGDVLRNFIIGQAITACRPPSNIGPANLLVRRLSSKNGWFPESIQPWSHHCYHSWVDENLWSASDWSFAFPGLMALNFGCAGIHVCSCPQVPESTAVASLRMPSSTHYYLNFLVLQWVTHGMNLTRYIQAGSGTLRSWNLQGTAMLLIGNI